MREYRERRQDFTVWLPQLDESVEEIWMDNSKFNKEDYYKKIKNQK